MLYNVHTRKEMQGGRIETRAENLNENFHERETIQPAGLYWAVHPCAKGLYSICTVVPYHN